LNTLFSKTLSLRSFINVRDQLAHTHTKQNNRQNYSSVYLYHYYR
jgi:hypothetical protein